MENIDVLKILILEDFESDVELIKREVRLNLNYKIEFKWVITEEDFTRALNEFHPDVILSDYNLPRFNGLEALAISLSVNDLTPFIIVTGKLDEETAAGSIKHGAWDYIVKERLKRLPSAIESALRLKAEKLKARKAQKELELIKKKTGIQLKLLYNAIDNADNSFIITDHEGIIQYVNPSFEKVSGYKAEEVIGENPRILKSNKHNESYYKNLWDTITQGKTFRGEMINKKKNGDLFWEMVSISSIKNEAGEIENYVAVKRDITENKKVQKALEESENWYRTIFENTGTASIIVEKNGVISLVNSRFVMLCGINKEDIEGKLKWMDFVPEPDKIKMIEYQEKRQKGEKEVPRQYEFKFVSPTGIEKNILLSVDLIPGTTKTVASLLDITERKKMELEIHANKERFQNLVENINDVLFETDTEGKLTYISPIIETITGYPATSYSGQSFFNAVYEEDLDTIKEKFENLIHKNLVSPDELRIKTKDGQLIWIRISANNIFENGVVTGIRGLAVDISHQKQAEQKLISAKEMAEENDRLKSAFLASMSHELRTPLNAIIGFSDLISENLNKDEIMEMGKQINDSGNHLLNIIEDIFEISLLQTKKHKIINEKFQLSDLFASLKKYINIELERTNKEHLSVNFYDSYPSTLIYTDKTKLNQLLINLLKNSIKFTSNGFVDLSYVIENDEIIFCVKDSGIGIPKEKIEIIFEQFRQVDDSLTRQHGGVGLGLSICKEISKILNGKLWVESEKDKGASFYLSLKDVIIEDHNINKKEKMNSQIDYSDKTILVVEDVESNYLLLKNYISILKAKVIWAKNGGESVKFCNENPDIDLVLMDIRMPDMDGFEATRQILETKPEMKIIAQTAYALKDDRSKAFEAGCIDYIAKPIRIADFNRMIKKHLS